VRLARWNLSWAQVMASTTQDATAMNVEGTFPRELGALDGLFALAETFAAGNSLGKRQRFLVDFVLEELFTNMVRHNPEAGGRIDIALDLRGSELMVQLRDSNCVRVDIRTDAPEVDPHLPIDVRTPGGLGIHLVKGLVDRIEYAYENRTGTIRLHKRLE